MRNAKSAPTRQSRRALDVANFMLADVHLALAYGAMSLFGFRLIRLNTQESRPLGLSVEQIAWFRGEIESALAVDERIVIFQHNCSSWGAPPTG